ncbi:ABC-type transport system ATP-binding protein [Gracilibacillus halophilus YIM-C55.5]|uniref:ABC-type transport system ATP-binding protein n=1 Tax=Gracilibacillus halophilus YIM-C55.5 TaxID=1308866 RepID=N4WEK3_9BACI|nr:ABC-F family ATP-binding cassette domain-containing protein [Gracilibacillus halophilus]ENH97684.1 ABC-type transport system ATP-binding protein [Gracilibacillus halophilus YIM-C55.5]
MRIRTLKVEHIDKTYGDKQLFMDLTFALTTEDRVGLIGVNGTGKSSLLKVLAGRDTVEKGSFDHPKDYHIEYLEQEPVLSEDTILDEIYYGATERMSLLRKYERTALALENQPENESLQEELIHLQEQMDQADAWDEMTRAKAILTQLGVPKLNQSVQSLSGGQKKRVAIAKALIQPADLLLLDEPTNHLDNDTIEWLEQYLPQYRGAILLVTHDRYFLNRITNRIFELDKGTLYTYEGNYETFLEQKAIRQEQEARAERKHQNMLKQEIAWLKSGVKARGTKQKARIDRVEAMKEKTFDTKEEHIDVPIGASRLGKKVIEVEGLRKSFDGHVLFEDFHFLFQSGDRIGIVGINGSGKTTLLHILAGRIKADQGTIDVGETVKIGYYTQEHPALDESMTVIDFIREEASVVTTVDGDEITAEQMLERFLFPRPQQWVNIRQLSGGERKRLYLLKVLMQQPNVLFLDEPTNDLDTETLTVLEDYLQQFPGVVVTVSHDRYFLDKTVDQLIAFTGDKQLEHYYGNYSDFRKWQKEKEAEAKQTQEKTSHRPARKRKKLSYQQQQEWATIEDDITAIETEIENVEQEIAEAGSDAETIQPLYEKQQELEDQLEEKMNRWEELSLLIEQLKEE